ncbi:helix-turn-helix domain-containing protein [Bacillus benzoevorans]|uniref:DNA-binding PucR family transcriptional regulator n=1 Tax=Bacillus benzoevorans TaxID=1456 RepID=A0A7X0HSY6_9BACI|nr:helix-turn-helix domain-containing protein [Bacillus benzoevorans]MBB6446272.1 DNA-binding PucR family transcriptional regulator [Bacillus benzoevorans]
MELLKKEEAVRKIGSRLRRTTRQLNQFDTQKETLQFLADSVCSQLSCDFIGIITKESDSLVSKVWSGLSTNLKEIFPIRIDQCNPLLFERSLMFSDDSRAASCMFTRLCINEGMQTWFTVPLTDDSDSLGFCTIGYFRPVTLIREMETIFDEFGKDAATAITLSRQRELEKSRMSAVEWMNQNLSLDSSVEVKVAKLVKGAGKLASAGFACMYSYDEKENGLIYQPPAYGIMERAHKIKVDNSEDLKQYFPCLKTPGEQQLTIPLVINSKTIGVLHLEKRNNGTFTQEDLETLLFLSNHVAVILENARLYRHEKDHKQKLHFLLEYQQSLVKETIEGNNFDGITGTLSNLFSTTVILLDRFLRPLSFKLYEMNETKLHQLVELATYKIIQHHQPIGSWFSSEQNNDIRLETWSIHGGGGLLGYLAVDTTKDEMDDYYRLGINLARNIYSLQFIKQKLVLDAREQVKDSFMNKLLAEKLEDQESIIQYANLFNWDLFRPHRVAVLSLSIHDEDMNILEIDAQKSLVWEQLKVKIAHRNPEVRMANKDGAWVLLAPIDIEENRPKVYWSKLYQYIRTCMEMISGHCQAYLAVGGKTEKLSDYYVGYIQALKALNVVTIRFHDIGFALFDELGSYTVLHQLKDPQIADLFIQKHLAPLLQYSEGKSMDLFQTLRVYLEHNGSIKDTAEELYIHRSSLLYRLEKIADLLDIDINDSESRFNLMIAYKLYDLYR